MKYYEISYRYKKLKKREFTIKVKAIDEKDAKRIAYNKIDNRVFEII